VPVDENGMKGDNLAPLIEKHRPKFIYVNSSYQDPTGKVLSFERRKKLLQLSYRYRLPIIEEDAASEIFYGKSRIPSIKAMDEGDNVIYIYSFSLTFIPGVGAAFAVAPKQVIKSLSYLVSVRLISLEWASEKMLSAAFANDLYYKKLEDFRREYKEKRDRMCMWLDKLKPFGVRYEKPSGGVYIWCSMPDKTDVAKLAVEAKKEGLNFVPGNMFYPGKKTGGQMIRLNFSYPSLKHIDEGMKTFLKLVLAQ
ncbi:MAG TPA: PLP-dependent aminotransferase family protein, partial [Bacillota bacterium]|nr:PLP-dependent aminotransferase family protein [Bacillota bacterium]